MNFEPMEGSRKRRLITIELRKVEQKILKDLNESKYLIDDLTLVNQDGKIDDFLDAFNETVELEKNMRRLYSLEEDRSIIEIKQAHIHKFSIKIINVFEM
jgi:hypothetical protein